MNFFNIGRRFHEAMNQQRAGEAIRQEAAGFKLASAGGYMKGLKYALFCLFGYYNARLFIVTVPGWEGYLTAVFALAGEATALYCITNFLRSSGQHQIALGVFGALLTLFSVTHATISWFRLESHAALSGGIQFYCERVAFPLLFGLLLLAAITIPLLHWSRKVASEQAKAQVDIQTGRARLVAETANLHAESELERERLAHLEEKIKLGHEYAQKLEAFAVMKNREREALARIADPELRKQIAAEFGITDNQPAAQPSAQPASQPTRQVWRGGVNVTTNQTGNA